MRVAGAWHSTKPLARARRSHHSNRPGGGAVTGLTQQTPREYQGHMQKELGSIATAATVLIATLLVRLHSGQSSINRIKNFLANLLLVSYVAWPDPCPGWALVDRLVRYARMRKVGKRRRPSQDQSRKKWKRKITKGHVRVKGGLR